MAAPELRSLYAFLDAIPDFRRPRGQRYSLSCYLAIMAAARGGGGPNELMNLVRNHWHIENRRHYVRDFTYDEDRWRARVGHLARNLACLSNAATSIVRLVGEFRYLPVANRHYAARPIASPPALRRPGAEPANLGF